jgi:protein-S-isoprenylcysteine O-methyltransferase Ste14
MINLGKLQPDLAPFFPYSIDYNAHLFPDVQGRLALDVLLLALFAIPHSIFARNFVKHYVWHVIPPSYYRTFYVFKSSACLHLLLKFWQPLDDTPLWDMSSNPNVMLTLYGFGWIWLVTSTFALDHFELFGLKDGLGVDLMSALGFGHPTNELIERAHYKLCRHPIMLGFFVMFFAVPVMTATHLAFSAACSIYILLAVQFLEEPDLVSAFGDTYTDYQRRVPMYCPFTGGSSSPKPPSKSD